MGLSILEKGSGAKKIKIISGSMTMAACNNDSSIIPLTLKCVLPYNLGASVTDWVRYNGNTLAIYSCGDRGTTGGTFICSCLQYVDIYNPIKYQITAALYTVTVIQWLEK